MKKVFVILLLIIFPSTIWADDSVKVPWTEIKKLYQESIEQKYKKKIQKKKVPFKYTIESADYRIAIDQKKAHGKLILSGKVVTGEPESFSIFNKDMIISKINQVSGGNVVSDKEKGILFWPNQEKTFLINLSFLLPIQEDSKSRYVNLKPPQALKNTLSVNIAPELRLLSHPGIKTDTGIYHFATRDNIKIRFSDKKELTSSQMIEIDLLSHIRIQGRQVMVTSFLYPVQSISNSFILELPEEAMYITSSLKKSWIKKPTQNSFQIKLPASFKDTFTLEFAYNETTTPETFSLYLPKIKNNHGNQGIFTLEQPEDGQIIMTETKGTTQIPANSLNKRLYRSSRNNKSFMKIPVDQKINLKFRRYQTVSTPPIVLDAISLFSSFEENGNILTLLSMEVPSEAGSRLSLKAIPDAEIWHLKVNHRKVKIYGDQESSSENQKENRWIIPLEKGSTSHVELAYIRKGEKIGLHGRLETIMPEIGLPSKIINVGIGLPKRVQLSSLEGPVSPLMKYAQPVPSEFVGRPYFFSRSFYNGDEMKLAISYKEPVNAQIIRKSALSCKQPINANPIKNKTITFQEPMKVKKIRRLQ